MPAIETTRNVNNSTLEVTRGNPSEYDVIKEFLLPSTVFMSQKANITPQISVFESKISIDEYISWTNNSLLTTLNWDIESAYTSEFSKQMVTWLRGHIGFIWQAEVERSEKCLRRTVGDTDFYDVAKFWGE